MSRRKNFDDAEKQLLIDLITENKIILIDLITENKIIENKKTDSNTTTLKNMHGTI